MVISLIFSYANRRLISSNKQLRYDKQCTINAVTALRVQMTISIASHTSWKTRMAHFIGGLTVSSCIQSNSFWRNITIAIADFVQALHLEHRNGIYGCKSQWFASHNHKTPTQTNQQVEIVLTFEVSSFMKSLQLEGRNTYMCRCWRSLQRSSSWSKAMDLQSKTF